MFITVEKSRGNSYLKLKENYSVMENGVRKYKNKLIHHIGPLKQFDDGQPNYIERLRFSFADGKPLIKELIPFLNYDKETRYVKIVLDREKESQKFLNPKNLGYFILDALYDSLDIHNVVGKYKSNNNLNYDVNGNTKLLIFGRVLKPKSKYATFESKEKFVFPITKSVDVKEIYYTLDVLNAISDSIMKRMHFKIVQKYDRVLDILFYDVTNFFFEIMRNDPDIEDEHGNIIKKGLRKKGCSKENRRQPIVQVGLFMDENGIPISYHMFPGNKVDSTTLVEALKKLDKIINLDRVIVVADAGLNSGPNISHIVDDGNGYIVAKSIQSSDKSIKKWAVDTHDYVWNHDKTFCVKSKIRTRKIKQEDGNTKEITEKVVCFWSKAHYDQALHNHKELLKKCKMVEDTNKLAKKKTDTEKFLHSLQIDKTTGTVIDVAPEYFINQEKVDEYESYLGYYTILTSEIDKPDLELIKIYRGLNPIEDVFRVVKTNLDARPIFVRTEEHINAHLLTCFIGVTMIRIIQYKIQLYLGIKPNCIEEKSQGLSATRIQDALNDYQCDLLTHGVYKASKPSEDLKLIFNAIGVNPELNIPELKTIRKLKREIDNAFQ